MELPMKTPGSAHSDPASTILHEASDSCRSAIRQDDEAFWSRGLLLLPSNPTTIPVQFPSVLQWETLHDA